MSAEDLKNNLVKLITATNQLPKDLAFYTATSPELASEFRQYRSRLLVSTNSLLSFVQSGKKEKHVGFEDYDDFLDRMDSVMVDCADALLERADTYLDEAKGIKRHQPPPENSRIRELRDPKLKAPRERLDNRLKYAQHLAKPQLKFTEAIDNSNTRFVPKLRVKLHAKVPLPDYGIPDAW